MDRPLKVGAVMYDPKVSVIWEIIRDFFESQTCPIDVAFYSTYEGQVTALLDRAIDVAWNSPLAWVDAQRRSGGTCRAIAMRDTDRDRVSYFVARRGGPVRGLADLRNQTLATGAIDSPQATLIPLERLRRDGLDPGVDLTVRRFDVLVGKHGDHVGGERDAFECVRNGEAAACAMLDLNWNGWTKDGTIDADQFTILAETDRFDHCVFTVRQDLDATAERRWLNALFAMRYDNPAHQEMMDLEGLKAWLPGRISGFGPLTAAVASERFFESGGVIVRALPLFPVTTVGSWPRPPKVAEALRQFRRRRIDRAELDRIVDADVVELLQLQQDLGCDIVTDGELRRDNFYSFVAEKLAGVRLMTLAEMLDVVEDKAGFERLLQTLDVPAYSISSPICTGKIERREPLAVDDLRFVKRHTDRPVKVTLPGPYLLTRAMFVSELTRAFYQTKEALAEDVVAMLRAELAELAAEGVDFVQFDEPVLTEVAFAPGRTRTFMCAALAARRDPAEELELAVSLINRVVEGAQDVRIGVHICRGNWSRDEATLLSGGYQPLAPYLERLDVAQLVLEYATDRAGDLMPFGGKELGMGVVNPRTDAVESSAAIRAAVEDALRFYAPGQIFLNPDCGFGTFSSRPMNTWETAAAKVGAMVAAARELRG